MDDEDVIDGIPGSEKPIRPVFQKGLETLPGISPNLTPKSLLSAEQKAWLIGNDWVLGYGITCDEKLDVFFDTKKVNKKEAEETIIKYIKMPSDVVTLYPLEKQPEVVETSLPGGNVRLNENDINIGGLLKVPSTDNIYAFSVGHYLNNGDQLDWVEQATRRVFGQVLCSIREHYQTKMSIDFAIIPVSPECLGMCQRLINDTENMDLHEDQPTSTEVKKWGPASGTTFGKILYKETRLKFGNNVYQAMAIRGHNGPFHTPGDSGSLVRCLQNRTAFGVIFSTGKLSYPNNENVEVSLVSPLKDCLSRITAYLGNVADIQIYYVGPK